MNILDILRHPACCPCFGLLVLAILGIAPYMLSSRISADERGRE